MPTYEKDFLDNISKTDACWLWIGIRSPQGYALYKGKGAHRHSWSVYNEKAIPPKMDICHTCDVRHCVNPQHLFLGTRKDNMKDAIAKSRTRTGAKWHASHKGKVLKGSMLPQTKLSEQDIASIKILWAQGTKQTTIAKLFNVVPSHISKILSGRRRT